MTTELYQYYDRNANRLESAWTEHLEHIWATDSREHYLRVATSDDCFWEFVSEQREKGMV